MLESACAAVPLTETSSKTGGNTSEAYGSSERTENATPCDGALRLLGADGSETSFASVNPQSNATAVACAASFAAKVVLPPPIVNKPRATPVTSTVMVPVSMEISFPDVCHVVYEAPSNQRHVALKPLLDANALEALLASSVAPSVGWLKSKYIAFGSVEGTVDSGGTAESSSSRTHHPRSPETRPLCPSHARNVRLEDHAVSLSGTPSYSTLGRYRTRSVDVARNNSGFSGDRSAGKDTHTSPSSLLHCHVPNPKLESLPTTAIPTFPVVSLKGPSTS
mmetsp:Transcript_12488/g.41506  ORF Transcript_12488/g.41506 Transcript_12488/m.41506 type:complete len:279 (-) Transcript_12488:254-1090(-)